jgi:hypothetical protein
MAVAESRHQRLGARPDRAERNSASNEFGQLHEIQLTGIHRVAYQRASEDDAQLFASGTDVTVATRHQSR